MPELPEVETIRRQLEKELLGSVFLNLTTQHPKSFRPSFAWVKKKILQQKIQKIDRQAKLLIFELGGGDWLLFHLKLTGRLLLRRPEEKADDYTQSVFTLQTRENGVLELRFADARKFGFVGIVSAASEKVSLLRGYGPEPFKDLTLEKFRKALKSGGQPVKVALLDQTKISGLGNIYVNDSLWLAKIDPRRKAKELSLDETKKLYQAVLNVLKKGLKYGGASDQWYRQVHGEEGKYQEHFLVYGKTGKECPRCHSLIKRIVLGDRGTFLCPQCQP